MKYSTFTAYDAPQATLVDEPWDVIVSRLTKHTITTNKAGVGLFNATVFGGSGRRKLATAVETSMLILDFDNAIQPGHPDYDPDLKKMVENPIAEYEVEAILCAFEFVLVTSHSHTDAWPRFRVVMPLRETVPATQWKPFASYILDELGLREWELCIDGIYKNPTQPYYWPSSPPTSTRFAVHNAGKWLSFNAGRVPLQAARPMSEKSGSNVSPFTEHQVATFWAHELPDTPSNDYALVQTTDGTDWRCPCPIHKGRNAKFYVNPRTGTWYCQSKCDNPKGGDMYKYVQVLYNKSFPEAKAYVHEITGDPNAEHTPEQLAEAIPASDITEVPMLVEAIAKQPKKAHTPLVQQLVTTHQLDMELVKGQIEEQTKVVRFSRAGVKPEEPTEANPFGLLLSPERYKMSERGVTQMKWVNTPKGPVLEQMEPPLSDRPIWPGAIGLDLATKGHYIQLSWIGSQGMPHMHWVPENIIRSRDALLKLDDAPISLESLGRISSWLAYAKTCISTPLTEITTQVGWFGEEAAMKLVMPGDPDIQYVGPDLAVRGSISGWALGLQEILGMGVDGYRALVALGLCAASPLVRLARKRNPVVGLLAPSGSGKNKVIEYGLSIWDEFEKYRVPADSSTKGMQDKAIESPDFPIFVDELQQLPKKDPLLLESVFYWMGNGVRRMTSSKTQTAKGGERRYGVSLFAAEHDIMQGLQAGAQNRVVALEGPPLRKNSAAVAKIEFATNNNPGVVGRAIAALMNADYLSMIAEIEVDAWELAKIDALKGDDPYTIALATKGLDILAAVTGLTVPSEAVRNWLVKELGGSRANIKDTAEEVFVYVIQAVMSMPWAAGSNKNVLEDQDGAIAWRLQHATNADLTPLEINPSHPKVVELLRRKNVKDAIGAQWGRKGWVHMNYANAKRARSTKAAHSPGAYAWRITLEGLTRLGLTAQFEVQGED